MTCRCHCVQLATAGREQVARVPAQYGYRPGLTDRPVCRRQQPEWVHPCGRPWPVLASVSGVGCSGDRT
jgi:hypothetical protein